jgi:deazaflavin-dependent oxidoreductase (nitroreductase family)
VVLPRGLARFNRVATNRVLGKLAGRVPSFAAVRHDGRRSGRVYETPINVFRTSDGYVAALTYGPDTDWVKNVLAAGRCELKLRDGWVAMTAPRIVHDEHRTAMPKALRPLLALPGAVDFLYLTRVDQASGPASAGQGSAPTPN